MEEKIGRFEKGRVPWNKGKKATVGTRKKMSQNYKYHVNSGCFRKGCTTSEKIRKKISDALKGKIPKNLKQLHLNRIGKRHTENTKEKIREAKKKNPIRYWLGKKNPHTLKRNLENNSMRNIETRKKLSASIQGISINKWERFISKEPYCQKWTNLFKRGIRKRDNQICILCLIHREKLKKSLDVHHINYDKKLTILQNCISLCKSCHMKTNYNRKYWINLFQPILSDKYGYVYENNKPIIEMEVIKNG